MHHASSRLRPWAQLTTGRPAALRSPPGAAAVAGAVAELQRCDAVTLVPSTLHGAWDLGGMFDARHETLHVDAEVYPVLRIAEMRARSHGVAVRNITHHDPTALKRSIGGDTRRPVVLVDGLCSGCGAPAPLGPYLAAVRPRGGLIVVDDTQAVGILGVPGGGVSAWGRGGGGSLRHHGLELAPDVLLLTSMAKALGAPLAAIGGSRALVERYERDAFTRVHCSPPSVAAIRALEHALSVNDHSGERRRRHVATAVRRLRSGLRRLGVAVDGGPFPVQSLTPLPRTAAVLLHRGLLDAGICSVPQLCARGRAGRVVFLLTAASSDIDVDMALHAIAQSPQLPSLRRAGTQANVVA